MLSSAVSLGARVRCFGCRTSGSWLCRHCRDALRPPSNHGPIPGVEDVHIPWSYEGAARDLVLACKLRASKPAAAVLAAAMAGDIQTRGTQADVITWVPGRRRDIRLRGFDHAELIAEELGIRTGMPVVGLLRRAMDRPDQTTLSSQDRWSNLVGAFEAADGASRVLLVDDLVTTGATAACCAGALRSAGAGRVEMAAPCRV